MRRLTEPSHLDLCCLQKPIIIACGSGRVKWFCTWTMKDLIRLCECTYISQPALLASAIRALFTYCTLYPGRSKPFQHLYSCPCPQYIISFQTARWRAVCDTTTTSTITPMHQTFEPAHYKTNKIVCAPSEDSDQPRHPPPLISICCKLYG